eukprot:753802-Hanusia_phi.AAC.2
MQTIKHWLLAAAVMVLVSCVEGFFTPASSLSLMSGNRFPATAVSSRRPMTTLAPTMVDIKVQVREGEPIESAMRRFKVAVSKSGHLMELKRRRTFETNNEKKIRKSYLKAQVRIKKLSASEAKCAVREISRLRNRSDVSDENLKLCSDLGAAVTALVKRPTTRTSEPRDKHWLAFGTELADGSAAAARTTWAGSEARHGPAAHGIIALLNDQHVPPKAFLPVVMTATDSVFHDAMTCYGLSAHGSSEMDDLSATGT